jgi:hypothetical protein
MNPVLHEKDQIEHSVHILDLTADLYFGETQVLYPTNKERKMGIVTTNGFFIIALHFPVNRIKQLFGDM